MALQMFSAPVLVQQVFVGLVPLSFSCSGGCVEFRAYFVGP